MSREFKSSEPLSFKPVLWDNNDMVGDKNKMADVLNTGDRSRLSKLLGEAVKFDEPMARHTSFRIGGPADALAEPANLRQLQQLLRWTTEQGINVTTIGGGSNLLVKDKGIRGVVIRLNRMARDISWRTKDMAVLITAGAGLPTKSLCALALRNGWQGANFALGIPGSLGGAVRMNAGTASGNMSGITKSITVFTAQGRRICLTAEDLTWHYRSCELPAEAGDGAIIVEMDLALSKGDKKVLAQQAMMLMKKRTRHQPLGKPSAGSIFKNPSEDQPAGRLIDAAGLKGARIGQAQVSLRHANFIVNMGEASADDVLQLIDLIQKTVWDRFKIELTPEVHIVG